MIKKYKSKIRYKGPFQFYRCSTGILDITLKILEKVPCGWEWGYKDPQRGSDNPLIEIRVGKLMVLYYEKFKQGFELVILGFWFIK